MRSTNPVYTGLPMTIFEVMSRLAIEHGAINLGQGFPDVDGPADVKEMAARELTTGLNQYPPMMGVPELRQAVAAANKRFYGLDVDWQTEVLVTSGATEALSDCFAALIEPGDEVVRHRAALRFLPAGHPPRRRASRVSSASRRPTGGSIADALAAAFWPEDQGDPAQQSDEPGGPRLHARRAGADRRARHPPRRLRHLRRGLRAHPVRRPPPHPADDAAGHARARDPHRLGRQDLLADRLEGRLRHRRADAARSGHQGAPVHDLHHAAEFAEGGRLRPRQGRRLLRRASPAICRRSAIASPPASRGSASASRPARAPISSPPTSRRSASTSTTSSSASA